MHVKVLVFLGHELRGAVKPAQLPVETVEKEMSTQLQEALKTIKLDLGQDRLANLRDSRALDWEAMTTAAKKQAERLTKDKRFIVIVRKQDLMIVGVFHEGPRGITGVFHAASGTTRMRAAPRGSSTHMATRDVSCPRPATRRLRSATSSRMA